MKEIRLLKLKLKNFKGIKSFVLEADGESLNIYGDNETGKTSLTDGWNWLLFDKDSLGQSNFDIKTLDENNNVIHGLEHEVEGVIDIDSKPVALRKVYYEKWTKKRGSAKETFSGHTTDYFIDEVPVKKSDYDAKIAEIIDEETFQMLTNPAYFNEHLHWQKRREILLEVCGNVSDEDVISANNKLTGLQEALSGRSIEDHRKVIDAKRKKINKELEKIPVRIDEVSQGLPDISIINPEVIKADIKDLKARKKDKEQELSRIESGGEIAQKEKRLAEIQTELTVLSNKAFEQYSEDIEKAKADKDNLLDKISDLERSIRNKSIDQQEAITKADKASQEMNKLREEWHEINSQEVRVDGKCPTCGQDLPEEQISEALQKANLLKSEELEKINHEGQARKNQYEELLSRGESLQKEINELKAEGKIIKTAIDKAQAEIDKLNGKAQNYKDDFQYKKKRAEEEGLEKAIAKLKEGNSEAIAEIEKDIQGLNKELSELESMLHKIDQYNQGQSRIEELKAQEKKLAAEYEKLEEQLYLTEEFTRTKVNLLEEKINSRFKYTSFKLFEEQVNGGISETCEALYKGVSYNSTLNTGGKFIIGIDIINTLSEHFNFRAPIFIDGRESVTRLPETASQLINLKVSEKDKKLRVEPIQEEMKEAV